MEILFSKEDKHFAMVWQWVLAVLCLFSTSGALITFLCVNFLVDKERCLSD